MEGDLLVAGTVDGELEATGSVEIDGGGKVTGPVTARNRLVVGPSGSLVGDVRVGRLIVQDGATFSGNVSMGKQAAASPMPAATEAAAAARPAIEAPDEPAASVAPAPAESEAVPPPAAAEPAGPAAAKSGTSSTKSEAWQMVQTKAKSNHRKDRHR